MELIKASLAAALMQGGGGSNLGEKTITQNGVYLPKDDKLDGYSKVTVNVPSGMAAEVKALPILWGLSIDSNYWVAYKCGGLSEGLYDPCACDVRDDEREGYPYGSSVKANWDICCVMYQNTLVSARFYGDKTSYNYYEGSDNFGADCNYMINCDFMYDYSTGQGIPTPIIRAEMAMKSVKIGGTPTYSTNTSTFLQVAIPLTFEHHVIRRSIDNGSITYEGDSTYTSQGNMVIDGDYYYETGGVRAVTEITDFREYVYRYADFIKAFRHRTL